MKTFKAHWWQKSITPQTPEGATVPHESVSARVHGSNCIATIKAGGLTEAKRLLCEIYPNAKNVSIIEMHPKENDDGDV